MNTAASVPHCDRRHNFLQLRLGRRSRFQCDSKSVSVEDTVTSAAWNMVSWLKRLAGSSRRRVIGERVERGVAAGNRREASVPGAIQVNTGTSPRGPCCAFAMLKRSRFAVSPKAAAGASGRAVRSPPSTAPTVSTHLWHISWRVVEQRVGLSGSRGQHSVIPGAATHGPPCAQCADTGGRAHRGHARGTRHALAHAMRTGSSAKS